jgi:tetratricopeptide (TPR) repeat protein
VVDNALALSYATEGNLALLMGNPAGARDYLQQALKVREKLAEADPQNRQAKEALATLYVTLGHVDFHLREAEAAQEHYQKALQLREALAKEDPGSVPFQKGLVDSHQKIGDMLLHLRGQESLKTVREHYAIAHELQQKLYQRNTSNTDMRHSLASSYYRLGTVARRSGEGAEAETQFRESLKLREALAREDPTSRYKQVELVIAQARCGEHVKAAEAAGRLRAGAATGRTHLVVAAQGLALPSAAAPGFPQVVVASRVASLGAPALGSALNASILYNLGCTYALCVAAVGNDPDKKQLTPEERSLREQYASEAIATLRQAINNGYNDRVSLETDPDLDALQGHPDYKELVKDLKQR